MIGMPELVLIAAVLFFFVGGKRVAEAGRWMGQGVGFLRKRERGE